MEGLLEILIPLIVAAVYLFGNVLSKSGGDKESSGERRARPAPEPTGEAVDPEEVERQRRVQEEIRRKIMERRQADEDGGGAGEGETPEPVDTGDTRAETEERSGAGRKVPERGTLAEAGETGSAEIGAPEPEPAETSPGGFSWETSHEVYDEHLRERMRQIEETKRRAARLQEQAEASRQKVGLTDSGRKRRRTGGATPTGPIREQLLEPGAARRAFIYSEILGRPKGLRRREDSPPGLSLD